MRRLRTRCTIGPGALAAAVWGRAVFDTGCTGRSVAAGDALGGGGLWAWCICGRGAAAAAACVVARTCLARCRESAAAGVAIYVFDVCARGVSWRGRAAT